MLNLELAAADVVSDATAPAAARPRRPHKELRVPERRRRRVALQELRQWQRKGHRGGAQRANPENARPQRPFLQMAQREVKKYQGQQNKKTIRWTVAGCRGGMPRMRERSGLLCDVQNTECRNRLGSGFRQRQRKGDCSGAQRRNAQDAQPQGPVPQCKHASTATSELGAEALPAAAQRRGRCARRGDAHCARPQRLILQLELRLRDYFVVWWLSAAARCQRCETAAAGPQINRICDLLRAKS